MVSFKSPRGASQDWGPSAGSLAGGRWDRGEAHLQGGTVATLAGVDGDDAVERLALAAEAGEANLRRRRAGVEVSLEVVGFWRMRA
jgi:hypothetical protein